MKNHKKIKLDRKKFVNLIKEQGRTREWLADQCGISVGFFNVLVSGDRSPGRPVLKLLAYYLECTEADLLAKAKAA